MPAYNYVELFNDHPGTYQDIPGNDTATNNIVNAIMGNPTYKNNTLIVVTEDDTQNGNNGADHVSQHLPRAAGGHRSPQYVKQHYLSPRRVHHQQRDRGDGAHDGERAPGRHRPERQHRPTTFPMTTADQAALGDPLEDFWVQGSTPLSASATGSPRHRQRAARGEFTGSATGGTAPYSYSWNFGDGTHQHDPEPQPHLQRRGDLHGDPDRHGQRLAGEHGHVEVTDTVSAVGNPLAATASAQPDLRPGPAERRLHRYRHRRHPGVQLQLELR